MSSVNTFSTVGYGSWIIPAGITSINVCAFGAGAGGANAGSGYGVGGGGGGFGETDNLTVTPGATVYYYVGQGGAQGANGANSWVNIKANAAPTSTANGALGRGGTADPTTYTSASAGLAVNCIGTVTFSGGYGINTSSSATVSVSGGGGGAGSGGAGANSSNLSSNGTITGGLGGIAGSNFFGWWSRR